MALSQQHFENWVRTCECPSHSNLFFIGTASRRITFYSQQVRATRLVHALKALNRLPDNHKVAVIGGGAAGATAAAALSSLGVNVVLYERTDYIISPQVASTRLLHPHIYEWPQAGSLSEKAGLPFLAWGNGNAGKIAQDLTAACEKIIGTQPNQINFKKLTSVKTISKAGGRWLVQACKDGADLDPKEYDAIILAIGFGDERNIPGHEVKGYWERDGVPSGSAQSGTQNHFISGTGDGGLTDLLATLIRGFDHTAFTYGFLGQATGSKLADVVLTAVNSTAYDADLTPAFDLHVEGILKQNAIIEFVQNQLRKDRKVVFNAKGGITLKKGVASILNQVMVYTLLKATSGQNLLEQINVDVTEVEERAGKSHIKHASGEVPNAFDQVTIRHGANSLKHFENFKIYYDDFKTHYGQLIANDPSIENPPELDPETWNFLDAAADIHFDDAQKQVRIVNRTSMDNTIVIGFDKSNGRIFQKGRKTIESVLSESINSPTVYKIHFENVGCLGKLYEQIVRMYRASSGKIHFSIADNIKHEWIGDVAKAIIPAELISPYAISALPNPDELSHLIELHLLNVLDILISQIIASNKCEIGDIHPSISTTMTSVWAAWRASLQANSDLRSHFVCTLWQIDKKSKKSWDGNTECLPKLACAIALALAAKAGVKNLEPSNVNNTNMNFVSNNNDKGVVIASACASILNKRIGDYNLPSDWEADLLILSGSQDLMFLEDSGGRLLTDVGGKQRSMAASTKVAPMIIQDRRYWREALKKDLSEWKAAVEKEFQEWHDRQDGQLQK